MPGQSEQGPTIRKTDFIENPFGHCEHESEAQNILAHGGTPEDITDQLCSECLFYAVDKSLSEAIAPDDCFGPAIVSNDQNQ